MLGTDSGTRDKMVSVLLLNVEQLSCGLFINPDSF